LDLTVVRGYTEWVVRKDSCGWGGSRIPN